MATNQILNKDAVAGFLFSNAAEYDATDLGDIENTDTAPTAVQIDLGGVAGSGARASTKADLGVIFPLEFGVTVSLEFATAPNTGETVDFYWSPSHSGTAGKGNMGWVSGTDGAYTGTPATLTEGLKKLMYIGSMICSADAAASVQTDFIGVFAPPDRYGMLVVHNNTSDNLDTDAIQMAIAFEPIIPDIQAAA